MRLVDLRRSRRRSQQSAVCRLSHSHKEQGVPLWQNFLQVAYFWTGVL